MTDSLPPILPYQTPTPIPPNFGRRAAKLCWIAPLAAVVLALIAVPFSNGALGIILGVSVLPLVAGLLSGMVALSTLKRYGRKGILLPAIIGLSLNLALLVGLGFFVIALLNGLAGAVR